MPEALQFRRLVVPASVDAPDAADFLAMVEVRNQTYRHIAGHDDSAITAVELLPHYAPTSYETRNMWVVVLDDAVVGRVALDVSHEGEPIAAHCLIELHPDVWGRGIGTRALELLEETARGYGRSVLQTYAIHPDAPGPRLEPPTGFGSIPAQERAARFLARSGFTLEQVERNSTLDLTGSFTGVERLLEQARGASADYRVLSWFAPTPPELVDGYAWLKSRMATDAPSAGLEVSEEAWDAARVAEHDARYTDVGRTLHVVAAQHVATGELCAFNELVIGLHPHGASHQEDTLVLSEHRGHRLGLLVKCENLLAWREIAPHSPRVMTFNAEENRPMLGINEEIGFTAIAYEGAWKKVLPA